jgi:hypothetical protein
MGNKRKRQKQASGYKMIDRKESAEIIEELNIL